MRSTVSCPKAKTTARTSRCTASTPATNTPRMSATSRWLLPQTDPGTVESLSNALALPLPVARVLVRRGYTEPDGARRYLSPRLDDLHDPFLLKSMRVAVDRLIRAVREGQPILLFGDYDVDGVTSIVILKTAIERM